MTTIATDGKTLAADRQITQEGTLAGQVCKVSKLNDGSVFGLAGSPFDIDYFKQWYNDGQEPNTLSLEGDSEAIHLAPDGTITIYNERGKSFKPDDRFQAIGSGAQFALAAMYAGKTPAEAVEIATWLDLYSSEPIDSMKC